MSAGNQNDRGSARRNALASTCALYKAGTRRTNWLYSDHNFLIGIGEDRVVVKLRDVSSALGHIWTHLCLQAAKPDTFNQDSEVEGHYYITFEAA